MINKFRNDLQKVEGVYAICEPRKGISEDKFLLRMGGCLYRVEKVTKGKEK
jgi:hypothetical protein